MGADIDLVMARREAERDMRDKCRVTRTADGETFDESIGAYEQIRTVVYDGGKARLKSPRTFAREVAPGSQLSVVTPLELQIPVASPDLISGDVVEILACPDRPNQVGRAFVVQGPFDGSQTTALRYRIEAFDVRH